MSGGFALGRGGLDPGVKLLLFAGALGAVAAVGYFVFKRLTSKIRPGWDNVDTADGDGSSGGDGD